MNKYCFFLNFGTNETQRVTTFILSSLIEYVSKEEALADLSGRLFIIFKNERRDEGFSTWFHSLSHEEYKNFKDKQAILKSKYVPKISREDFSNWIVNLSMCSFSGFDAIGEVGDAYILGWEIRTDLLTIIKNEENLVFVEFNQGAENDIVLALSNELFE